MSVIVYTSRISCRDPDRFDITRKSGGVCGEIFAPSWRILRPALALRAHVDRLMAEALAAVAAGDADEWGPAREAERIEEEMWAAYVPAYMAEMRESYRAFRGPWKALLARDRVVLVCYCVDALHCHRMLLAERCLRPMGADVRGEL